MKKKSKIDNQKIENRKSKIENQKIENRKSKVQIKPDPFRSFNRYI